MNEIKQAAEYGLRENHQTLIALLMLDNEIHSLGLDVTQGLVFAAPGYWDLNEGTRAFSKGSPRWTKARCRTSSRWCLLGASCII